MSQSFASADPYPGLKAPHMGDLAGLVPKLITDTREQDPLVFERLPSVRRSLYTGDYSVVGLTEIFAVERKSISDLVGSISSGRERFCRELHRLRGHRFKRLLIIGSRADIEAGNYRSRIKPASVLNTLSAFEIRYEVPVVFAATPELAARLVERWAYYMAREVAKESTELLKAHNKIQKEQS